MMLRHSCRETARLITARLDRELSLVDRITLRLHFLVCKVCPRVDRQMRLMHQAMGCWRAYAERDLR